MAFQPYKHSNFDPSRLADVIMTNSTTYNIGDAVKANTTGYAVAATAAAPMLGIVIGFKNSSDTPLTPTAYAKGTTAILPDIETFTAASDNQTNAQSKVIVCFDKSVKWSAQVNGTIGTTNVSNLPGGRIDIDSANSHLDRVLESTQTRTAATKAVFYNWGTDPNDSTRLIVSIAQSELDSNIG